MNGSITMIELAGSYYAFIDLYPFKRFNGNITFNITRVGHTLRFNKNSSIAIFRRGLMLDPSGNNYHFTGAHFHCPITKAHDQRAFHDDEGFVCFRMAVPDEVAFEFYDFKIVVVHPGDYANGIVTGR